MGLKEAYQEKMEAELKEWSVEIDRLKAKAANAKADAKLEYEKQLSELRVKHSAANTKLQDIKRSSSEAWEELKAGSENAFDEIRKSIKNAAAKFK